MSELKLETATRQGLIPLIGLYGKSGSGKTHSALLLARGLAGRGRIAIIDTERKRSGALVGMIPGGDFLRINLDPPFSPSRYTEAIRLLEASDIACGVIDSQTHEWHGEGGVLDMQEAELTRMAGETDWKKREACKMAAWIKPKQEHALMMDTILRCKIPLVCCLRGKEKTHIGKDKNNRTEVYTDEFTSPVSDKDFIFEMLLNAETIVHENVPGCLRITKYTHAGLLKCLPEPGQQVGVKHGEALARWLVEAAGPAPASAPTAGSVRLKALKRELWELTKEKHLDDPARLQQWLVDEMLLSPDQTLSDCDEKQLDAIIVNAKKKLNV